MISLASSASTLIGPEVVSWQKSISGPMTLIILMSAGSGGWAMTDVQCQERQNSLVHDIHGSENSVFNHYWMQAVN